MPGDWHEEVAGQVLITSSSFYATDGLTTEEQLGSLTLISPHEEQRVFGSR